MNYNRSMTEYDAIVGASIYYVAKRTAEKLRKENTSVRAAAIILKDEVGEHCTGHAEPHGLMVNTTTKGMNTDLRSFFPDISDPDLLVKWSDVAKLIKDDSFYAQYIHPYKPSKNPLAEAPAEYPTEPSEAPQNVPALFDYSELPKNEADELRKIEQVIKTETASYFTILGANFKAAQDLLANHSGGTFERWYTSVGFKRQTVYRLIQRYEFMCSPKLGERRTDVFEELPLSLSCEISRKDAPTELVEKVLSGDITSHKEYQKLKKELEEAGKESSELRLKIKELESRPAETVVEKQEVIPEGYISPEEHQRALDEEEKRAKKLSDEIMRLKSTQNAEKSGKLTDRVAELEQQLAEQQRETTKAYGKASKASYDSETKGRALEEAQQKNAELEKELAELRSAEKTDPAISEKLFKIYKREVTAALTGLVVFANAPENREYKRKAAELLESYMKTLQEDSK